MPKNDQKRPNDEVFSLTQAASWIGVRREQKRSSETPETSIEELHGALKAGMITGSGCVDGGERRAISREEWQDYCLRLRYVAFAGVKFSGSSIPVIDILSIRSYPAGALKYRAYPTGIRIPSPDSKEGEAGYHRVITDVLLPRLQIMQCWPQDDEGFILEPALQQDSSDRRGDRNRPSRDRARDAINSIYSNGVPDQSAEPNAVLCGKVGQWLKDKALPDVSDDTILRAAGRR